MENEEKERLEQDVEGKLAYVLAKTYVKIPWKKIGVKSAHTFFVDRVRAASKSRNIRQFMEELQKTVNVEFVDVETEFVDFLEENRPYTLQLLRKETNYIVMLALENVDQLREAWKLKKEGQGVLL